MLPEQIDLMKVYHPYMIKAGFRNLDFENELFEYISGYQECVPKNPHTISIDYSRIQQIATETYMKIVLTLATGVPVIGIGIGILSLAWSITDTMENWESYSFEEKVMAVLGLRLAIATIAETNKTAYPNNMRGTARSVANDFSANQPIRVESFFILTTRMMTKTVRIAGPDNNIIRVREYLPNRPSPPSDGKLARKPKATSASKPMKMTTNQTARCNHC